MVQVESLQAFVIGLEIGGREVTPFLNRWSDEALWFSNVTDQTGQGRSSDSELATQVSMLPLAGGAAAFRFAANDFTRWRMRRIPTRNCIGRWWDSWRINSMFPMRA